MYDLRTYVVCATAFAALTGCGGSDEKSPPDSKTFTAKCKDVLSIVCDDFDLAGGNLGVATGVVYVASPQGRAAVLSRSRESRLQYALGTLIPTSGTLEFIVKIESAYRYENYTLRDDEPCALVFTTDIHGGDVAWSGSAWLWACKDGEIVLHIAGENYEAGYDPKYRLTAKGTNFRFGEWHRIGISYGLRGKSIMVNGKIVGSSTTQVETMGVGGNHTAPVDIPTIGEPVSGFWADNQWEGGFEGQVEAFRASSSASDWVFSR